MLEHWVNFQFWVVGENVFVKITFPLDFHHVPCSGDLRDSGHSLVKSLGRRVPSAQCCNVSVWETCMAMPQASIKLVHCPRLGTIAINTKVWMFRQSKLAAVSSMDDLTVILFLPVDHPHYGLA